MKEGISHLETIAQKEQRSQESLAKLEGKDLEHRLEHIDPEEFWEELGKRVKEGIRITLDKEKMRRKTSSLRNSTGRLAS